MEEYFRVVTLKARWFSQKGSFVFMFLVILLFGIFLRFHELGEESIWVDEAFTYHYVNLDFSELIETLRGDVHPVLFYTLGHWWVQAFGNSEFSLRFLPFLFGSLSIIVMFFLVRELYGRKRAVLSMLFFSLSYTMILYSQEAKMYMQFMFFFLLGLWFLIRFVKNPSGGNLVVLTTAHVLLLHTHFLSFVVILLEVALYLILYYIFSKRNIDLLQERFGFASHFSLRRFGYFLGVVALSYVLWIPIFINQVQYLLTFVLKEKFELKFGFDGFYALLAAAVVFNLVIIPLWWREIISHERSFQNVRTFLSCIKIPSWMFAVFFLIFLWFNWKNAEYYFGNVTYIRYLIFLVPLLHIFLGLQMMKLERRWFVVLLLVYIVVTSSIMINYYSVDAKEQWREAAGYVQENVGNDVLLFHTSGHTWWAFNYYFDGNVTQVRLKYGEPLNPLYEGLRGKEYAYLILSHNFRQPTFFNDLLDKQYKVVEKKEFIGITIYKYSVGQKK